MPEIECDLRGFGPKVPPSRTLHISVQDLIRTAALVGLPTLATDPKATRPWLEMQWRTALVQANLQLSPPNKGWSRSEAYDRLDPTEKTAVSYFLGMVQAELTTRAALGYSHLVHVDHLLRLQGSRLGGSRPDFVAIRLGARRTQILGATVEAKGRTNGFSSSALKTAKKQAKTIPMIRGIAAKRRIASEAYFDSDNTWASVLEDPDGDGDILDVGIEGFLLAYYRTIIDAGRASLTWTDTRESFQFALPGLPLVVSVPARIVRAYDASSTFDMSEREARAPILQAFYRQRASAPRSSDGTGDLIGLRLTANDLEPALVALFTTTSD